MTIETQTSLVKIPCRSVRKLDSFNLGRISELATVWNTNISGIPAQVDWIKLWVLNFDDSLITRAISRTANRHMETPFTNSNSDGAHRYCHVICFETKRKYMNRTQIPFKA
jgi:hypothetical protein